MMMLKMWKIVFNVIPYRLSIHRKSPDLSLKWKSGSVQKLTNLMAVLNVIAWACTLEVNMHRFIPDWLKMSGKYCWFPNCLYVLYYTLGQNLSTRKVWKNLGQIACWTKVWFSGFGLGAPRWWKLKKKIVANQRPSKLVNNLSPFFWWDHFCGCTVAIV